MIAVRFDSLKDVVGSTYMGVQGYEKGWFSADDVGFGHGSQFRAGKGNDAGGASLDMFVEKAEKNELTITKPVDIFTPYLMFKAATDRKLKDKKGEFLDISFLSTRDDSEEKDSGARAWLRLTFGTCFLIEWKLSGSASDSYRPTEDLTITYNQVAIGYCAHHKKGPLRTDPKIKSLDLTKLGAQQSESDVTWPDGTTRLK